MIAVACFSFVICFRPSYVFVCLMFSSVICFRPSYDFVCLMCSSVICFRPRYVFVCHMISSVICFRQTYVFRSLYVFVCLMFSSVICFRRSCFRLSYDFGLMHFFSVGHYKQFINNNIDLLSIKNETKYQIYRKQIH